MEPRRHYINVHVYQNQLNDLGFTLYCILGLKYYSTFREKKVRPGLSATAWLRGWTQLHSASLYSIMAEARVTPVIGQVGVTISMIPALT